MARSFEPSPPRYARSAAVIVVVLALALACAVPSSAQDVTEPSLKAAYIYNIAKFTVWPPDALPEAAPLTACVVGDTSVGRALERAVQGRSVMGHLLVVARVAADSSLRACHLLYAGNLPSVQMQQVADAARGMPILTVVDVEAASHPGVVAHIFVENGKVRFNLDRGLAKHGRLQLSSKLLDLAKRVYDQPPAGGTR